MRQHFQIVGTGHYLPKIALSAAEIDHRAELPAGWTESHVGVIRRHECRVPETLGTMAGAALSNALQDASISWSDIDLILDASTSRHQPIPSNATFVQQEVGAEASGIPCLDIHATCLGFMMALQVANGLFAAGGYRHIVIVCSEAATQGVNWKQPESACLMGDGAAAAVVRRVEPQRELHFEHETFSEHIETCHVRGGCHGLPPFDYTPERDAEYRFHMDGPALFRIARKRLLPLANRVIEASGIGRDQLHVIPHQASPSAVELIRRLLRLPSERYDDRIAVLGNMVAASIPTVLDLSRSEGRIQAGDPVMLLGTSAGYSQAAMVFYL